MDAQGSRGATLSSDVFSLWDLDWNAGKLRIVLQTGEQVVEDMGSAMSRPSREIARSVFDWDRWWLTTFTTRGHLVISEVWSPVGDPVKGRPAVYLDQNHWSTVAKSLVRPQALSPPDLAAAQRVVALAMDGGIRLPISSATLQETAALFGERRYEVGITIASLSGGWQLRDPIEVRKQEFAAWFAERLDCERRSPLADVVTLEPRSVFGDRVGPAIERPGDASSAELFLDALTWPSVLVSLLIDPEPTPSSPPEQWAQANEQLAERIRTMTREQRTSATTLAAIADNQRIIVEALARLDDPAALLERVSGEDLADAVTEPSFGGLFTRVMAGRLMDANRRWRTNDLNDVMFLACAAAYCEYVAAEKSTGRQLAQVIAGGRLRSNVFVSLPELVAALHRDGVATAAERASREDRDASSNSSWSQATD